MNLWIKNPDEDDPVLDVRSPSWFEDLWNRV